MTVCEYQVGIRLTQEITRTGDVVVCVLAPSEEAAARRAIEVITPRLPKIEDIKGYDSDCDEWDEHGLVSVVGISNHDYSDPAKYGHNIAAVSEADRAWAMQEAEREAQEAYRAEVDRLEAAGQGRLF